MKYVIVRSGKDNAVIADTNMHRGLANLIVNTVREEVSKVSKEVQDAIRVNLTLSTDMREMMKEMKVGTLNSLCT